MCLQYIARVDVEFLCDQGASTTGVYADSKGSPSSLRIRKTINRFCESARVVSRARLIPRPASLAKIMVYSMAVDGPIRSEASPSRGEGRFPSRQAGYLAGSKAMESLEKFITSTESFFHPSNSGLWSLSVRTHIQPSSSTRSMLIAPLLVESVPSFSNIGILQALARRRAAELQNSHCP